MKLLEVLRPGRRMSKIGTSAELRTYKSIFGARMFSLTYPSLVGTNKLEERSFGSQREAHTFFILNPAYGLNGKETI